jgi:hypothetical protein
VTNEYGLWHSSSAQAKRSPNWQMTSGSLYSRGGAFWTGVPDSCAHRSSPDQSSTNCTNSNVFRLRTTRSFAGNLKFSVQVRQLSEIHNGTCDTTDTCWHGTHLWLRYRNEYNLYYASINRADGKVVIKRKVPCGSDNRGTYVVLGRYVPHDFPTGVFNSYSATVETGSDGAVTIKLYDSAAGSTPIVVGVDRGGTNPNWSPTCNTPGRYSSPAYPPLTGAGAVGIRGDFANFEFTRFKVTAL